MPWARGGGAAGTSNHHLWVVWSPEHWLCLPWKPHTMVGVEPGPTWASPHWSLIRGLVSFLVNDVLVQLGSQKQEAP